MNSYIALDLEMTGLNPKYDKIMQIGALKVIEGEPAGTFDTLVNPGRKIEEKLTGLTGITNEMLENAPSIEKVMGSLIAFCEDYPLLGHSIISDYSFVKQAAVNAGFRFEKTGVDTLKISRACHLELPSKKLSEMCAYYNIPIQAHRAINDAIATSELYQALKAEFYRKYPDLFEPKKLHYEVKKESPIRASQLERLQNYIERHGIDCPYDLKTMTRNEATRYYDMLCSRYGK